MTKLSSRKQQALAAHPFSIQRSSNPGNLSHSSIWHLHLQLYPGTPKSIHVGMCTFTEAWISALARSQQRWLSDHMEIEVVPHPYLSYSSVVGSTSSTWDRGSVWQCHSHIQSLQRSTEAPLPKLKSLLIPGSGARGKAMGKYRKASFISSKKDSHLVLKTAPLTP